MDLLLTKLGLLCKSLIALELFLSLLILYKISLRLEKHK